MVLQKEKYMDLQVKCKVRVLCLFRELGQSVEPPQALASKLENRG